MNPSVMLHLLRSMAGKKTVSSEKLCDVIDAAFTFMRAQPDREAISLADLIEVVAQEATK